MKKCLLFFLILSACSVKDSKLVNTSEKMSGKWLSECTDVFPFTRSTLEIMNSTPEEGSMIVRKFTFSGANCTGASLPTFEQYTYTLDNQDNSGVLRIQNVAKIEGQIADATYQLRVDDKFLTLTPIKVNVYNEGKIKPLNETGPQVYHK